MGRSEAISQMIHSCSACIPIKLPCGAYKRLLNAEAIVDKQAFTMGNVNENNDHLVKSDDPDHPANLIPRLCRQFYTLGILDRLGSLALSTET